MVMQRSVLLFVVTIGLVVGAACCGLLNPASRLYGKWKLDVESTIDRNTGGNDVQAGLARAAWGMFGGDIIVEFRSDGTGTFTGNTLAGGTAEEGTWSLVRADSDTIVISFTGNNSGQTREMSLLMTDPDTFEFTGDNGNVVIFRRVQQ